MHWIYGGAWTIGSNEEFGTYDGTNLAKKNKVVVVAGNYRLDVLGWLALNELGVMLDGTWTLRLDHYLKGVVDAQLDLLAALVLGKLRRTLRACEKNGPKNAPNVCP